VGDWDIYMTSEVAAWLENLQASDTKTTGLVDDAIYALSRSGPALGRPLVDTIAGSKIKNLKELRPGSSGTSKIRILFAFDPWRSAVLLVAGDKSGKWNRWYAEATPHAEQLYEIYLKERAEEEEGAMSSYTKWDRAAYIERVGGEEEAERRRKVLMARQSGYRLAEERKRRGLTQAQLAQAMRVSAGRVSQIERGELATIDAVARYVEALGGRLELIASFGDHTLTVTTTEAA
jgi:DNA-binding XRE family transcriptional regulator